MINSKEKENEAAFRADFERLASDPQSNFRRSRRGTYVNPAVARDWKWFELGAIAQVQLLVDNLPK